MSYGPIKVFSGSIASGASTLTSLDISKAWSRVYCEITSLSTNAELTVYGSSDGSTFRPVYERVNTAPVQYQALTIASGANNGIIPLDVNCQYVQFRASATVAGGATIKLICVD